MSTFGPHIIYSISRLDEWLNPTKVVRGLNIEDATFHYDLKNWVIGVPKSLKNITDGEFSQLVVYDASSNPAEVHEFGTLLSKISYNEKGEVASVADGEGARTLYEQYRLGTPRKVSLPDASTESYAVDDVGQITSYTDGVGVVNAYAFDKVGRPASANMPGSIWSGTAIRWTLSAAGVPSIIAGPHWQMEVTRGSLTETTFLDALSRPLAMRSCSDGVADCITQAFRYDLAGNLAFVSYPAPGLTPGSSGVETTFDLAARPVLKREDSEHGKLDTRYSYTNRQVDVTGPKGESTRYVYNLDPQDPAATLTSVTSPTGIVQTIGRDAHGRPLKITQAGKSRSFSYGKGGKLCRISEPERGTEFRGYDGAGRLAWSAVIEGATQQGCGSPQDASKTVRTYDPVGRLASISYPDGKANARFSYDHAGNLVSAATADTAWTYAYNALGLPTLEALTVEGRTLELAYGYDPNGSIAAVTYPNGRQIDYQPNGRGFPRRAGKYVTDAKYAPDGSLSWFRYANGVEYLAERNVRNLISHMTYARPSELLFSQDLGYDVSANLEGVNDLVEGEPRHRRFGFDSENRLASVKDGGGNLLQNFQYDAANNIAAIGGPSIRTFEYDPSNRLAAAIGVDGGRHTFRYDFRGNLVGKDATNFLVDSANRLVEVSGKESYVYDAFGHRASKGRLGTGGSKTYYLYNQAGRLFYEVSNDRTAFETDYIYLGSRLVAKEQRREKTLPGGIWFSAATPVNSEYTVLWGRIDGDVVYELEERRDGGAWAHIHRGRETSVGRPHLGGTYQYRVRVCTAQCGEWVESINLGVIPRPIFDLPTPGGYGGLWGAYEVAWQPSVGATGYDIDETTPHGWQRIASNHPRTSIERPGNVEGSYSYRVSAVNAHGSSLGVVNFPAVTVRPPIPPPDGYFYFDNVDLGAGTYRLNWIVDAFSPPELQEQRNEEPWVTIPWGTYEAFRFYVNAPGKSTGSYRYRIRYCIFACSDWLTSQQIHISR